MPCCFPSTIGQLTTPDQAAFLSDNFDVNGYAKAVLAGKSYQPDDIVDEGNVKNDAEAGRGDIGSELAKLNQGIVSWRLEVTSYISQGHY